MNDNFVGEFNPYVRTTSHTCTTGQMCTTGLNSPETKLREAATSPGIYKRTKRFPESKILANYHVTNAQTSRPEVWVRTMCFLAA